MNWATSYQDVLAATHAWVTDPATGGYVESWRAYDAVAGKLGVSRYAQRGDASGRVVSVQRFDGQVKRALDALASEGVLVKAGRNVPGPGGSTASNQAARYWTPEKYSADEKAEQERQAAQRERAQRWAAVHDALVTLGITPRGDDYGYERGRRVHVELADFELLLAGIPALNAGPSWSERALAEAVQGAQALAARPPYEVMELDEGQWSAVMDSEHGGQDKLGPYPSHAAAELGALADIASETNGEVFLCDHCYEDGTGNAAVCQDDCSLDLEHVGVCGERYRAAPVRTSCDRCGSEDRLTMINVGDLGFA
jgi:hypothetical protein